MASHHDLCLSKSCWRPRQFSERINRKLYDQNRIICCDRWWSARWTPLIEILSDAMESSKDDEFWLLQIKEFRLESESLRWSIQVLTCALHIKHCILCITIGSFFLQFNRFQKPYLSFSASKESIFFCLFVMANFSNVSHKRKLFSFLMSTEFILSAHIICSIRTMQTIKIMKGTSLKIISFNVE